MWGVGTIAGGRKVVRYGGSHLILLEVQRASSEGEKVGILVKREEHLSPSLGKRS